jgi:inosine-uridine nucleoside N-ribohydrolase
MQKNGTRAQGDNQPKTVGLYRNIWFQRYKVVPDTLTTMAAMSETVVSKSAWTDVVAAKRATRRELVEKHSCTSESSPVAPKITKITDVDSLTRLISSGEVSAEGVIRAYISK